MKKQFYLYFDGGMPKGTAQQKGEAIRYKNGVPYIQHYKKDAVSAARELFTLKLKPNAPKVPTDKPVRLYVWFVFDHKDKKKWGEYKTTRPDCDNYVKELKDAMTDCGFWLDDAQVCDLRVVKTYGERASIVVNVEDLEPLKAVKV